MDREKEEVKMRSAQDNRSSQEENAAEKRHQAVRQRHNHVGWGILLLLMISILFSGQVFGAEKVIAHGGGAYQGYETTNSLEAVQAAITNGFQWIELDMDLSADGKIIMIHDWDKTAYHYFGTSFSDKLTEAKFNKLSVHQSLEVLTFEKLVPLLDEYPYLRIVTDTKGDNLALLTTLAETYPDYVAQMIPQIYDEEQWATVHALGFTDIIFTLYQQDELDLGEVATFVKARKISAVTMPDYYADQGYSEVLAATGVRVYVHPIASMEEANTYLKKGAYGVYSGTLLPAEFQGPEKTCYLMVADAAGGYVKLTDVQLNKKQIDACQPRDDGEETSDAAEGREELQRPPLLLATGQGDSAQFFLDDVRTASLAESLLNLNEGKHVLRILIAQADGERKGELEYLVWKEGDRVRILDDKYAYRLNDYAQARDFEAVMSQIEADRSTSELLRSSLIAKAHEYRYYDTGAAGEFRRSAEYFPVQLDARGKVMLPLLDTALALGAESVAMEKNRDLIIDVEGQSYRVMVNGPYLRQGSQVLRLETPVSLYLNKAAADGAFFRTLMGRTMVEKDGLIIVLPEGAAVEKTQEEKLLSAAKELYHQELVR